MRNIVLLSVFVAFCFGGTYSNMESSGFSLAWQRTEQYTTHENKKIKEYWQNKIKPLIEKIAKEVERKNKNLNTIKALEKDIALKNSQILFLLEQEKQLLSKESEIKGENK